MIDKEHAEALSSGQWLGQDGKPESKVCQILCANTCVHACEYFMRLVN